MCNLVNEVNDAMWMDTSLYLNEFNEKLKSFVESLKEENNKLKNYLIFKLLAEQSCKELTEIDPVDIEERLMGDTENISQQAKEIVQNLTVHSQWLGDILVALNGIGDENILAEKHKVLNQQIETLEQSVKELVELRNKIPIAEMQ